MGNKDIIYFNISDKKTTRMSQMLRPGTIIYLSVLILIGLFNLLAWLSTAFCDWHTEHVFPIWVATYGRFTSLFPFSVGEGMLIAGVILLLLWVVLGLLCIGLQQLRTFTKGYSKVMLWIVLAVCFIMTENCSILYHTSTFEKVYPITVEKREYDLEELTILRDYLVDKCNELSTEFDRDDQKNLIYHENIREQARMYMQAMGETYPRLEGYYVRPKYFTFSGFFSQQHIMGYYFPFSLESHLNKLMYIANLPSTACHELAHMKGFMYEADANFIGFLACTDSDNSFFEYCGYLSVLTYVDNDFYDAIGRNREVYKEHPAWSDLVRYDSMFLSDEAWEKVHKKAVLPTETVKNVSDGLMDTSIKLNGIKEGKKSYNKVVALLLQYYDGTLY